MLSTTALNVLITNKIKDWHPGYDDVTRQLNRFRRIVFARLAPLDLRTFGNLRIDQTIKRDGRRAAFFGLRHFRSRTGQSYGTSIGFKCTASKRLYEGCKTLPALK